MKRCLYEDNLMNHWLHVANLSNHYKITCNFWENIVSCQNFYFIPAFYICWYDRFLPSLLKNPLPMVSLSSQNPLPSGHFPGWPVAFLPSAVQQAGFFLRWCHQSLSCPILSPHGPSAYIKSQATHFILKLHKHNFSFPLTAHVNLPMFQKIWMAIIIHLIIQVFRIHLYCYFFFYSWFQHTQNLQKLSSECSLILASCFYI